MSSSTPPVDPHAPLPPTVVILGNDAQLAARPATPVQLAHACFAAGFRAAIPVSWGDELVAAATLEATESRAVRPLIQCACPHVARRMLAVGAELAANLVSLVAPPVAVARYVRSHSSGGLRVTYVGRCPAASDDSIDARLTPEEFLAQLAERGIRPVEQPEVFESVIPPDRRRHYSLPGGVPTPDLLWARGRLRLETLQGDDFATDLAERVLSRADVLIDAALVAGCVCSGAGRGAHPEVARSAVSALEPPRAATPVIEPGALPLELPIPLVARAESDVLPEPRRGAAPPLERSGALNIPASTPLGSPTGETHPRRPRLTPPGSPLITLPGTEGPSSSPGAPRRRSSGAAFRVIPPGSVPLASDQEGRTLPRAYVARRRSPRGGVPVIPEPGAGSPSHPPVTGQSGADLRRASGAVPPARVAEVGDASRGDAERAIEHGIEPAPPAAVPPEASSAAAAPMILPARQAAPAPVRPAGAPSRLERSLTLVSANPRSALAVTLVAAGLVVGVAIGYGAARRAATTPDDASVAHEGLRVDSGAASAAPGLGAPRTNASSTMTRSGSRTIAGPRRAASAAPSAGPRATRQPEPEQTTASAPLSTQQTPAAAIPSPPAVDSAAVRARRDSAVAATRAESLAAEREAIQREIARRRARLDSLMRAQGGAPPTP